MDPPTIEFGLSGFAKRDFEDVALQLLRLAAERGAVELRAWDVNGQYFSMKFAKGTDYRDASSIFDIEPDAMMRLGCVFRIGVLSVSTNVAITLHRRAGWTLVEGDLYLHPLMRLDSPADGIRQLVSELAFFASALELPVLNVVDEHTSVEVRGAEVREPALVSIVAPYLAGSHPMAEPCHGRSLLWVRSPQQLVAGEPVSAADIERFLALWDGHEVGDQLK